LQSSATGARNTSLGVVIMLMAFIDPSPLPSASHYMVINALFGRTMAT